MLLVHESHTPGFESEGNFSKPNEYLHYQRSCVSISSRDTAQRRSRMPFIRIAKVVIVLFGYTWESDANP